MTRYTTFSELLYNSGGGMSMKAMCVFSTFLLAGCATPFGNLSSPPKWCMAASAKLAPLEAGDDLVQAHADLKEQAAKEASRVRCLQRYARAVTN